MKFESIIIVRIRHYDHLIAAIKKKYSWIAEIEIKKENNLR
jgi:hypothetical protein